MKIAAFLLLLISFSSSAGFMLDKMDQKTKSLFVSDMAELKQWKGHYGDAWFKENLGIYTGSGNEMYEYLTKNVMLFSGRDISLSICSLDENYHGSNYEHCSDSSQNYSSGRSIAEIDRYTLLDPGFAVFFPSIYLDINSKKNALYMSKGGVLPIEMNSSIFVVDAEKSISINLLGGESAFWYRIAHYLGLARAGDLFAKQIPFANRCSTVLGQQILCEQDSAGPFSVTGLFLRDFAVTCAECSPESRVIMTYVAADYLLRVYADPHMRAIAQKIAIENEDAFIRMGLDEGRIKELYRWSVTQ